MLTKLPSKSALLLIPIFGFLVSASAADVAPPAGYSALFDGTSMKGWFNTAENVQTVWEVDSKGGILGREVDGGYLWTEGEYSDFVLEMEFKLSRHCNSGVFFRSDPSNPVQGGFEIQLFDTPPEMEMSKHTIGALFDAKAASSNPLRSINEWNALKLEVRGDRVKVWINGVLINEFDLSDWTTAGMNPDGTANKFKTALCELPRTGHIGLQDHGSNVWFRNIFIKEL